MTQTMVEVERIESENQSRYAELFSEPSCDALKLFLNAGKQKSQTAQWMANRLYGWHRGTQAHSTNGNDSFWIAHLFELSEENKKESSLWVVENGLAGYLEGITHQGFDLVGLLKKMGALEGVHSTNNGYIALSHPRIKDLAKVLKISDNELADCAENIILWCLNEGYLVREAKTTFSASTPFLLSEAEVLARTYLDASRRSDLDYLFSKARVNDLTGNKSSLGEPITYRRI